MIKTTLSNLQAALAVVPMSSDGWKPIEACLYTIRSIASTVDASSSTFLPQLLAILPSVPVHPSIQYTASLMIHRYSSLIGHQNSNPSSGTSPIQAAYNMVLQSMQSTDTQWKVSSAAVMAMKSLAADHPHVLGASMLQLYGTLPSHLSPEDSLVMLEGVCKVLSQMEAVDQKKNVFGFLGPIVQSINTLTATSPVPYATMNNELKRIICIIEFIKWKNGVDPSVHPTMALLSELWPILEKCVSVAGKHEDIAESICRIFKRVIRSTTPLALNPMVPNLAHLLTSAFETTFQSSYLYCASVCITDFSEVQEAHSALLTMSAKMFHLFSTTAGSLEKYIEFPDVTDEMFYMMEKCLKHLPQLFSMPIVDAALKVPSSSN